MDFIDFYKSEGQKRIVIKKKIKVESFWIKIWIPL